MRKLRVRTFKYLRLVHDESFDDIHSTNVDKENIYFNQKEEKNVHYVHSYITYIQRYSQDLTTQMATTEKNHESVYPIASFNVNHIAIEFTVASWKKRFNS